MISFAFELVFTLEVLSSAKPKKIPEKPLMRFLRESVDDQIFKMALLTG